MIDENGLNTYYEDTDNDGFGDAGSTTMACTAPSGYVSDNTDCDDTDDTVFPGATELCDGQDNDCNGALLPTEIDGDGDGHVVCTIDAGGWDGTLSVVGGDDCDDGDINNYPGNTEICDGQDNDCDGMIDENGLNTYYADTDNDGFGDASNSTMACSAPSGFVLDDTDCDDNDMNNYHGNMIRIMMVMVILIIRRWLVRHRQVLYLIIQTAMIMIWTLTQELLKYVETVLTTIVMVSLMKVVVWALVMMPISSSTLSHSSLTERKSM